MIETIFFYDNNTIYVGIIYIYIYTLKIHFIRWPNFIILIYKWISKNISIFTKGIVILNPRQYRKYDP